jgi:hypothetical protein
MYKELENYLRTFIFNSLDMYFSEAVVTDYDLTDVGIDEIHNSLKELESGYSYICDSFLKECIKFYLRVHLELEKK